MKTNLLWRATRWLTLLILLVTSGCTFSLADLPDIWLGGTPQPPLITGPTPTPMPVAQVTFQVRLPAPLGPGEGVAISLLDEVTGLPFNAVNYPLQALDAQTYGVILPLSINAVIRYRYMLTGTSNAQEDSGRDLPVRYRLFYVTGSGTVNDMVASWSDRPYTGIPGSLLGRVLNAENGQPVPNLMVSVSGQSVLTDSTGSFSLTGLPDGTHNLVIYALDGGYHTFQQGARIEAGRVTPVEVGVRPAPLVAVTFLVSLPSDTISGAPIRLAGNLLQLGNTFGDLQGGVSGVPDRMPVLARQPDGRYMVTLSLPVGADVQYKYTMGDGFWNAEHRLDGTFEIRRLIVPAANTVVEDAVSDWQAGIGSGPILFEVTVPANTPVSDIIYIQFNPYGWTEPIPMWPMGNNRWDYRLYGPFNLVSNFTYRVCRNAQCGTADDVATAGPDAVGVRAKTSLAQQDLQYEVTAWTALQTLTPTTLVGTPIQGRSNFVSGIEFAPRYAPNQYAFVPQALANAQAIGANWVMLTPAWTFGPSGSVNFAPQPGSDPLWSDTSLQIGQARALGLNVALYPGADFPSASAEWWRSASRDSNWWQNWFESYRRYALQYADLAARNDAQALILGGEWVMPALPNGKLADGQSSSVPAEADARWRALITEIRARYGGLIWWAWPYQPGGFASAPAFLSELNGTYLLVTLPFGQQSGTGKEAITTAAGQILDNEVLPFAAALQKPVILAFAIPSAAADGTVNLQAQMDAYEAVFTAVNQRAWISGVVSRGYSLPVILHDGSASINGTPTSDLLWYWLAGFRGIPR